METIVIRTLEDIMPLHKSFSYLCKKDKGWKVKKHYDGNLEIKNVLDIVCENEIVARLVYKFN